MQSIFDDIMKGLDPDIIDIFYKAVHDSFCF